VAQMEDPMPVRTPGNARNSPLPVRSAHDATAAASRSGTGTDARGGSASDGRPRGG
jgi:hypothetical protein